MPMPNPSDPGTKLEQVIKSSPVDITARLVTSKGAHWDLCLDPIQVAGLRHQDVPHELLSFSKGYISRFRNSETAALEGRQVGYLTVLGCCARSGGGKHHTAALYSCRCVCGRYEARTERAILAQAVGDRCLSCRAIERARERLNKF